MSDPYDETEEQRVRELEKVRDGFFGQFIAEELAEQARQERIALIQRGIAEGRAQEDLTLHGILTPKGAALLKTAAIIPMSFEFLNDSQVAANLDRRLFRPTWRERLEDAYRKARYRLGVWVIGWDPADDD